MSKTATDNFAGHTPAVRVGDTVVDPLDGSRRRVVRIAGGTLYMADGGVMGVDEVRDLYLPGEVSR